MPNENPKSFAKGFEFTGSINGHRLGWTKARVVFDYRNGAERVLFEFECGLEVKTKFVEHILEPGHPPTKVEVRHACPRLEQFARPGEEMGVSIEQLDRRVGVVEGGVISSWSCMRAKLVEYSVAWDNNASAVTPERIVFEAPADAVASPHQVAAPWIIEESAPQETKGRTPKFEPGQRVVRAGQEQTGRVQGVTFASDFMYLVKWDRGFESTHPEYELQSGELPPHYP